MENILRKIAEEKKSLWLKAVLNNDVETIKKTLDSGFDVNTRLSGDFDPTAFIYYAKNGNMDMLILLLNRGADISLTDRTANTAFSYACARGDVDMVNLLLNNGVDPNEADGFIVAGENNRLEIVKILLEKGANVDFQNKYGYTTLILTSYEGHEKLVDFLLDFGANLNIIDNFGQNAFISASLRGRTEIMKKLLKKGVNEKQKDIRSKTGLFTYVFELEEIDPDFLEFFIEHIGVDKIDEYLFNDTNMFQFLKENEDMRTIWNRCVNNCLDRIRLNNVLVKEKNKENIVDIEEKTNSYLFIR